MAKTKEQLRHIFNDTKRTCETTLLIKSPTKKFGVDIIKPPSHYRDPKIIVVNSDTVSCAGKYAKLGRTCLLNMASATKAGGGVEGGETAQEECLFRCSNLYSTVTQDYYPLEGDVALYTKNAVFLRGFDYDYIPWFKCDVVTVASVNLNLNAWYDEENEKWVDGLVDKPKGYWETMRTRVRLMCTLAGDRGVKNLILGAWGCGVFKNDPNDVAEIFYEVLVLERYMFIFDQVVFAIINDNNSVANNYEIFKDVFDVDNL